MEFRFKIQDYQTDAVNAVVNVFEGQPYNNGLSYLRDIGTSTPLFKGKEDALKEEALGYCNNRILLDSSSILHNITTLQKNSNIPISESLSHELGVCSLDVEMETGTGKTYVYIKTMFELNKKYGWNKYIVVVPSIAIREGVKKSFEMTVDHFMEYYNKKARFFVYDSNNLNQIEAFSSSADLNVMIINMQAFNSSLKEGANNKNARKIYSERDEFGSRRPIDVIKANHPILILDEPQKMEGTKTQDALKNFNPLFCINYSATHRKKHNSVYVLDALDAFNKRLVKKIEVKGFEVKNIPGTDGYLFLHEIILSPDKPPMAKIEFEILQKNGVKRIIKKFGQGTNLYAESGRMSQYAKDYYISSIDAFTNSISFANGITLKAGDAIGDVSEDDIRRIQIRETISSHFDKEEKLFRKGIKTLSLFFIDEVAKYRKYDDAGNAVLGEYGKVFEEEYEAELHNRITLFSDDEYQKYLSEKCSQIHSVHNGYFSIDKNGHYIDSKESERGTNQSDDISAYDLILKNKERLLSLDEPTRFIFSHSALREGWDNPNIFQICTLKHSNNNVAQRQEVGRGLRICVDKDGNRMDKEVLGDSVFDINMLTVVASDSYASFVSSLQSEMLKDLAERPRKADENYFTGKYIQRENGETVCIDAAKAKSIYRYLIRNEYINMDDSVSTLFKEDEKNGTLAPLPPDIQDIKDVVVTLVKSVFDPSVLDEIFGDARTTKVKENPLTDNFKKKEFQELWKAITPKFTYEVEFDSDELIEKASKYINDNLNVRRFTYVVSSGQQKDDMTFESLVSKDGFDTTQTEHRRVLNRNNTTTYDLLGRITRNTNLTRRTVAAILKKLNTPVFDMFKINPEDFIRNISTLINDQKANMVVEHITYHEAKGVEPYSAVVFTAETTERSIVDAYIGKKSVQKYIFPDGLSEKSVERNFAEGLDKGAEVLVYAKLPRGFKIPTPLGGYAPDWAIVFNKDDDRHIFFIAETKGTLDIKQLKEVEQIKIECARELFRSIKSSNIHYKLVTDYDDLVSLVK